MKWMRAMGAIIAVAAAALVVSVEVSAEAPTEGGTVSVGPIKSGNSTGGGNAGFDQSGIGSNAGSQTAQPAPTQPPPGGVPGLAPAITFRKITNNALPCGATGPAQQGTGGAVIVPVCVPASACPSGQTGFLVYDATGAPLGLVCVDDQGNATARASVPAPLDLAQSASARQPWPMLVVGINPGVGLTGLASWFWLSGSPSMPDATASAGPLFVTVRATLDDITWDFGDGATASSGNDTGREFPSPSSIQHVYQTDSFESAGLVVSAVVRYRVAYSVNGGPFLTLGVKARPYRATYQVNQLQPQAVDVP